ncbi:MAG: DUF2672 domain-containing protein [Rickettsia endosymbiont of Bryobia graminum]|nr:DUF2672 domain-containing protein [Rickettsia endosymbiont of Bryobia graminum]
MSLGEILIVALVAIIVAKPEDIPILLKKIQQFKSYFSDIKNQLLSYVTKDIKIENMTLENTPEQLNYYLERIIDIQGYYEGNYSLEDLKAKHKELIGIKNLDLDK